MTARAARAEDVIGGQTQRQTLHSARWRFVLFNPTRLFRALGTLLRPIRHATLLLWPAAVAVGFSIVNNWYELLAHTQQVFSTFNIIHQTLLTMITANLLSKIMQGLVINHLGGRTDAFGVKLILGVYPRFFIPLEPVRRLPFRAQRTCYAAALKTRLALFVTGILVWTLLRQSGSGAAEVMLVVGQVGLGVFLFSLNPLWPADGYRWMSAYLEEPRLREDGLRVVRMALSRRPMPAALSSKKKWALITYIVLSMAYMATFIVLVSAGVAYALETRFSGTGVVIFSLIAAMMIFYLVSWYTSRNEAKTRQAVSERKTHGEEQAAAAGGRDWISGPAPSGETVTENSTDTAGRVGGEPIVEHQTIAAMTARARWRARTREADGDTERQRATPYIEELLDPKRSRKSWKSKWKALLIWAALIAGLLYVAFLPYSFEVGGDFVVRPIERAEVRARTGGEVLDLLVQEGDWVTEGQVMARLSSWDQEHNIAVREAEMVKARADLATLVAGPRPEEISVAEQRIASSEVKVEYTKREFERQAELLELGAGAGKQVDVAESQHLLALSEVEQARAELGLLRAPVLESQVAAAEAAIERDARDLEHGRLQLEHTKIRANADGYVVTSLAGLSLGTYLPVGGLFAELEDSRTVLAEIEVPETEISEVEIGARAEMKLWSSPRESVNGTVRRIAPKAEEREFGRVVRVLVEVPNPDRRLTPNMTGFGKVAAEERPVWEAFTRSIVRFFQIELWSWLP